MYKIRFFLISSLILLLLGCSCNYVYDYFEMGNTGQMKINENWIADASLYSHSNPSNGLPSNGYSPIQRFSLNVFSNKDISNAYLEGETRVENICIHSSRVNYKNIDFTFTGYSLCNDNFTYYTDNAMTGFKPIALLSYSVRKIIIPLEVKYLKISFDLIDEGETIHVEIPLSRHTSSEWKCFAPVN